DMVTERALQRAVARAFAVSHLEEENFLFCLAGSR
ncbi:hypothetical protein A2U01_0102968, partial [Trifolium medium]|nr:hypothetical protein [Trifolium medium]